jgi:hypothetical protein
MCFKSSPQSPRTIMGCFRSNPSVAKTIIFATVKVGYADKADAVRANFVGGCLRASLRFFLFRLVQSCLISFFLHFNYISTPLLINELNELENETI